MKYMLLYIWQIYQKECGFSEPSIRKLLLAAACTCHRRTSLGQLAAMKTATGHFPHFLMSGPMGGGCGGLGCVAFYGEGGACALCLCACVEIYNGI